MIRIVTLFLTARSIILINYGTATADSPQPDGPPDKGNHSWCYASKFKQQAVADAAMTWLRNQTVVDTIYYSSCNDAIDVKWTEKSVPNAFGSAVCKYRTSLDRCDQYIVTLNMTTINASAHPASQRRKTACHELGHTVGVRHYSGDNRPGSDTTHSCLRSGPVPTPDRSWHKRFGNHHRVSHINPWFA